MVKNLTFDTKPLVIHAQGPHDNKPYWKPIRDNFFASPKKNIKLVDNLTMVMKQWGFLKKVWSILGCLV